MPIYIKKSDYGLSPKKEPSLLPSQAYGGGLKFGLSQEEKKAQDALQRDINLMLERKEPLDKIARDLKIDFNTLKKNVEQLQPNYQQISQERDKNWFERNITWSLPKKVIWDTLIYEGLISPAKTAIEGDMTTFNALKATRDISNRNKLFDKRQAERRKQFGDPATWTDETFKNQDFVNRLKAFDAETRKLITPDEKTLQKEKETIDKFSKVDPLKYGVAKAETFLNLYFLGGASLVKKGATGGIGAVVKGAAKPKIPSLILRAGQPMKKRIATEVTKDVLIGGVYSGLYNLRTDETPTVGEFLKAFGIGGAIGVPAGFLSAYFSRAMDKKALNKIRDQAYQEGQKTAAKAFKEDLAARVATGQITKEEAKKVFTDKIGAVRDTIKNFVDSQLSKQQEFINSLPKDIKKQILKKNLSDDEIIALLQKKQLGAPVVRGEISPVIERAGGTIGVQKFAEGQLGTTRPVTQAMVDDIVARTQTATAAVQAGTADQTAVAGVQDELNSLATQVSAQIDSINSIPQEDFTPALTTALEDAQTRLQQLTDAGAVVAPTEAAVTPPAAATTPTMGAPAPVPGQAPVAPVKGTVTPQAAPKTPVMELVEAKKITRADMELYNKVVSRISRLQVELEKLNAVLPDQRTAAQAKRIEVLQKAISELRKNPSFNKTIRQLATYQTDSIATQIQSVADEAYQLTRANGGVTIDLGGNKPAKGFAFAPNKGTETIVAMKDFAAKDVRKFIEDNIDELVKDGNHIGMWVSNDNIYMDISLVGEPSEELIAKAQAAQQEAVYDLENGIEVATGKMDENNVYIKLDEAANIYNQYKGQVQGTTGEAGVGVIPEVSEGAPAVSGAGEVQATQGIDFTKLEQTNKQTINNGNTAATLSLKEVLINGKPTKVLEIEAINSIKAKTGSATQLMKNITDYADANNIRIILKDVATPKSAYKNIASSPEAPMTQKDLTAWYEKLGFKRDKAKLEDGAIVDTAWMIRKPNKTLEVTTEAPVQGEIVKATAPDTKPEILSTTPQELSEMERSELVKELFDEVEQADNKITGGVLSKLDKMVANKVADVIEPLASTTVGSKIKAAFNNAQTKLQNSQAALYRPLIEAERTGAIPEGTVKRISTFVRDVKGSIQEAQTYMVNNENWNKVVAPMDGKPLKGKNLQKLNDYIEAKAELNLMNIDKVDDPVRRKKFEGVVDALASEDFDARYQALIDYNDELLTLLVDNQVVSPEKAALWRKNNEQYVRVQREVDELSTRNVLGGGGKGIASIRTTAAEQRRMGSTKEMRDIIQVSAERTQNVFHEIKKNIAANELIDAYQKIGQELADPVRTAENVITRNNLRDSLRFSRPLKQAFDGFYKTQRRYVNRIQSELDTLNKEGLEEYLKKGTKEARPVELRTKIRVLRDVDPDVPLTALKEEGKWRNGTAPDISTIKTSMSNSKYWNQATGDYSEALKRFATTNDLTDEEALAFQYMKGRRFDGFDFNGKEFVVNDAKLGKKAGDMLLDQEITGKVRGVTSSDKKMGTANTVRAVDNLISYPTSELNNIRRKIARREPKLAEAIDELINIKTQLDDINATRKSEWEEIMRRQDEKIAGNPTIARRVKGVDEVYITTPEIEAAAKGWGRVPMEAWMRAVYLPVRVLKSTITGGLNPAYTIRALVRDPVESFVLSPTARATHSPQNIVGSMASAAGKSDLFEKFLATEGGTASYIDFIRKPKDAARLIREQSRLQLPKVKRGIDIVQDPVELYREFEDASRWQEKFSRFQNFKGAYDDAIKRGLNETDALIEARWAARENQVDFFKTGDWTQVLNSFLPYFNSSIQGGAKLGNAFRTKPVSTSLKLIGAVQIPTVLATMYNLSDPRRAEIYQDIPDYEKENNWVFVLPGDEKSNGRWRTIKFPKPPGVGAFSNPVEKMMNGLYGYDPVEFMDFVQATFKGFGSPIDTRSGSTAVGSLIPQIAKPTIQSITNYDFFTGKEIVPTWLKEQESDPFNQSFSNTSGTAKELSKLLDISPLTMQKWLTDTFGTFGKTALYDIDTTLSAAGVIDGGVGGKSRASTFTEIFATSPGGNVDREVKDKLDNIINTKSRESSLVTDNLLLKNTKEANRIANDYNASIDALMETIYDKPEFTTVSMSQIKYLESLKFPMKNGQLTESSIKARLKSQ